MERFRLHAKETEMKSLPAKIFFLSFTFLNLYSLLCIIISFIIQTQLVIILAGYIFAWFLAFAFPVVILIYTGLFLTFKHHSLFKHQKIVFIFNFVYLLFLFGGLIYYSLSGEFT